MCVFCVYAGVIVRARVCAHVYVCSFGFVFVFFLHWIVLFLACFALVRLFSCLLFTVLVLTFLFIFTVVYLLMSVALRPFWRFLTVPFLNLSRQFTRSFWELRGFKEESLFEVLTACNRIDRASDSTVLMRAGTGYAEYLPGNGEQLSK